MAIDDDAGDTRAAFIAAHVQVCQCGRAKKYDPKRPGRTAYHTLAYSRRKCAAGLWRKQQRQSTEGATDMASNMSKADKTVEAFNAIQPVGSTVWYRSSLLGPVMETTVREPAFVSDAGRPVVFLDRVSGYVSLYHVMRVDEAVRPLMTFVQPENTE